MRFALSSCLVLALAIALLTLAVPSFAASSTLTRAGLCDSLAFGETHIYRVEGDWKPSCDSMIVAGGTSLDCFALTGELPMERYSALDILLAALSRYSWVRSARGWPWHATPALAFSMRTDSAEVALLLSLKAMRAAMSAPGEGTVACELPDRDYAELAWCVWALDPESPEVQPFVRDQLKRKGIRTDKGPPERFADFLETMLAPDPRPGGSSSEVSTQPVYHARANYDRTPPQYPSFAFAAGIEGTVVLRVHVDRDGHPGEITTVHSIPGLDTAAKAAVSLWTFQPATQGGASVDDWIDVEVPFSLRDELNRLRPHQP